MTSDRQATQNYSQGIRAEQIARGAFVNLQSQLIQEIVDKSTRYGADGTTGGAAPYLYWPLNATNMVLQPSGLVSAPPLVKISRSGSNFYSGGATLASAASTTTAAPNGRLYSLARWNKPQFFTNWPAAVPAPDWVNVTRAGPQVVTIDDAKNAALNNDKFVVGRYAYTIYDTGGLLDINQAGYTTNTPSNKTNVTQPVIGQKGYVALADLTQIPNGTSTLTQDQVNNLVEWRNRTSGTNTPTYLTTYLNTNGGLSVFPGDNTFINRQDLITYAQANGFTNALPYFSTFNRSMNTPSYCPDADAASGGAYAYLSTAFNALPNYTTNYCLPNVRVGTGGWPRGDGSTAVAGEPLVKQRFPLSRLALMSLTAPTAAQLTQISTYFGLTIDSSNSVHAPWKYNALAAGNTVNANVHICTLGEVAALGREPNFFELLKAAILTGSTGRDPGNCTTGGVANPQSEVELASSTLDLHIMRIGVNIIDQYGATNFTTTIDTQLFSSGAVINYVYGEKNLPYFQRVTMVAMDYTPPAWDGSVSYLNVWLQPVVWNPHQNTGLPTSGPSKLRVQAFGSSVIHPAWYYMQAGKEKGTEAYGAVTSVGSSPYWSLSSPDSDSSSHTNAYIPFSIAATNFWTAPVPLTVAIVDSTTSRTNMPSLLSPVNWPASTAAQTVGFGLPPATYTPDNLTRTNTTRNVVVDWQDSLAFQGAAGNPALGTFFAMQWLDTSVSPNVWRTYQIVNSVQNLRHAATCKTGGSPSSLNSTTLALGPTSGDGYALIDPRTDRFGVGTPTPTPYSLTGTIRTNTTIGAQMAQGYPIAPAASGGSFTYNGAISYPGTLSQNTNTAGTRMYYTDRDNVLRGADGLYESGTLPDGYPLALGSSALETGSQRPLILGRPFRSVGELGYVFRDVPFKSLDFFTAQSGDSGLLDLFSIDQAAINSGKVNLNSAPSPVIKALLSNSLRKEADSSQLLTTDANAVATYLTNQLATTPLIHRGGLVPALASIPLTATADKSNKTQREASIRALAEVTDTRTWNLLIDVVAQAGRYPPQAGSLSGDFQVQGEKRYWLHLAIDRVTGQVLASQLEPVYE